MAEIEAQVIPQEEPVPSLFKKRAPKKSTIRKRQAIPENSEESSDYSTSDDGEGHRIKRRRKIAGVTVASKPQPTALLDIEAPKFTADRSAHLTSSNDATKQSNWFDEQQRSSELDPQSLLGKTHARPPTTDNQTQPYGTYKGVSNYQSFIQKNPNAPSKQVGPIKAPTNIRTITVTDFAPDVSKDYKQTGFCGFGDSCKFLHAREDYKQGWQLDKEWETVTKGKKLQGKTVASANRDAYANGEADSEEDERMLEGIPFACIICKEGYKNPIITKCGHYFCEDCALKRYRKTPNCAACGAGTNGVFNGAKGLKKLLERKRARARKRREKARDAGEEVSEEDEDE